jgi:hypothetical protein
MPQPKSSTRSSTIWQLILVSSLVVLFCFMLPAGAYAAPPSPAGAEICAKCHADETDAWHNSPHAKAVDSEGDALGATCEDCHGSYVADHPEADVMQLTIDSSACKKCHISTFRQWEGSIHAQNGVQCIGCHLSHSQEFRISDEQLCASCHREHLDTAHGQSGVSCIDCHLSATNRHEVAFISTDEGEVSIPAPSHDFTAVLSKDCVNCHGQDVHQENIARVANVQSSAKAECEPELVAKLESTQQENQSLMTMTPVSLGLGIGIGGMLGVIFMLVIGYINQGVTKQ